MSRLDYNEYRGWELPANENGSDDMVPYRAYWALFTAQKDVATWAPSCSDTLAEDWRIV